MKKTFKRAISLMAVLTLVFALCIPAFAATTYTQLELSGEKAVGQGYNVEKDYKIYVNAGSENSSDKFEVKQTIYDVFYEKDSETTYEYDDGTIFGDEIASGTYNQGHDYLDCIAITPKDANDKFDITSDLVTINSDKPYHVEIENNTLYVYRLDTYSIKIAYDLGELKDKAIAPVDNNLYMTYDSREIEIALAPEIEGYTFKEWSYGDKSFKAGDKIKVDDDLKNEIKTHIFTAVYEKTTPVTNDVTVKFNANGKTFKEAVEDITVVLGKEVTLPSAVSDNTAYEFVSWNTNADGKGTAYKAGAKFSCSEDTTLYATWKTVTKSTIYTLTFNNNCDNSLVYTPDTRKAPADSKIHFRAVMTRSGYKLAGWSTNPDGTGDKYNTEDDIVMTSDITLYAIWEKLDDKNTTTTKPTTTKQDDTTTTTKKETTTTEKETTTTTKPTTTRPTTTKSGVKDETTVPNTGSSVAMAVVASVALVAACAAILVVTKKNKEEKTEA